MATLFSKLRAWTLGNAHDVLNAVIDLNSIPVIEQYVRDLEAALKDIRRQAATAQGRVDQQKGEISAIQAHIKENTDGAEFLLNDGDPSNDGDAEVLMRQAIEGEEAVVGKQEELAALETTARSLADASQKISAKHVAMLKRLRGLRDMDRTTKAKEDAAAAIEQAGDAAGAADNSGVDNLTQRMKDRAAVADAVLTQATGSITDSAQETLAKAKAAKRVADMRAKLTQQKSAG